MTVPMAAALVVAALLVACGGGSAPLPVPPGGTTPDPAAGRGSLRPAGPDSETEQTPVSGDEVVRRFVEAVSPTFGATGRGVDEPYPLSPDGPLPRRIEAWSFVAGESEPSDPGVRLRYSLRVFEFGSIDEASDALAGLAATADGSMLLKSPLLAVRVGSSVLRLDGACSFSRERWVEVQDALIRTLPPGGAMPDEVLEILCGGSVVRTPGSGPPGGGRREEPPGHGVDE